MLKIINLRHGAIVNRNHGNETDSYIELPVDIFCDRTDSVLVNGEHFYLHGQLCSASVRLNDKFNTVTVSSNNKHGRFEHSIDVVWDKQSFKRYNFFIDDNVFFLTEIARSLPKSIFDHFYLKRLKEFHRDYGTKFTLNIFYKNDHDHFLIKEFPDKYKAEWQANSDWLKLAFHAYSEFPDRPYQNASAEKLASDYDLVAKEIIRFAGEETLQPPIVIHWAMVQPDAFHVLRERGVKILDGQFIGAQTAVGQKATSCPTTDIGYFQDMETAMYLKNNTMLYDYDHNLMFMKGDITCNLMTKEQICSKIEAICQKTPRRDTINLATHEQYSFAYYHNYIPDHLDRMEYAIKMLSDRGYKPVFFHDGLLGNASWDR
jgi:hypothetical protein